MNELVGSNGIVPVIAMFASFLIFFGGTMFSLGGFRKDLSVMQAELKSMTGILIKQQTIELRITNVEERARERYTEMNTRITRLENRTVEPRHD